MKSLFLSALLFGFLMNLSGQISIGDQAPNFELKNIDQTLVSLSQFSNNKGVIIVFTCNHCPYAKLYEDRIIALDKEYKPKGYSVVAINPNNPEAYEEDSFENMVKRAADKNYTFPYLVDDIGLYMKYGATKTPHVYLLNNEEDKWLVKYIGAIDDSPRDSDKVLDKYLANAIDALLSGTDPKVSETKAIGCSIKPY